MLRVPFLVLLLPLRLIFYLYVRLRRMHRNLALEITLKADYTEAPMGHGFWSYFKPAKDRFYLLALDLASALSLVEQKRLRLGAVRLILEPHNLGWAQAWEIRDLLTKLRRAGVRIDAYLLSDDRISAFIASAADTITAPETASFDFSPFTSESVFVQSFLNRLGIRPQFLSVGDFKSAAEIFTRTGMSPAARRQTEELIGDLETTFYAALAEKSPAMKQKNARRLMGASQALGFKFLDSTVSHSEFLEASAEHDGKTWRTIDIFTLEKLMRRINFRLFNFRKPKRVALLVAEGNIIESAESRPGTINWPDYEQVSEALSGGGFAGALLRINSPGGSALVSQLIWREWMLASGKIKSEKKRSDPEKKAKRKKEKKEHKTIPVFVSQGNVAASGGYYLSAVGDKIFSTPMSVTGSIGVVGGKFNIAPLLNKWGITIDRAPKKNPAPAFSLFADFDAAHKKAIRDNMHEVYDQFLRDVALGRHSTTDKIKPHAGGRVYSGERSMKLGLTDAEGGIATALRALREAIGARPKDPVELVILPAVRESLFNRSLLPFGLSRLASLADFSRPGIYTLDTRFLIF